MNKLKILKSKFNKLFSSNIATKIILTIGIILRFIAYLLAMPSFNQHDVIERYGHFDYAMYLFMHGELPQMVGYEFSQPPINAFLQSLVMRFLSLFKDYSDNYLILYSHTKILTFIWSVITLILIYKILEEFDIDKIIKNIILFIMSFYPGLIIMTTQYSNDQISYMFFYLSLLLTIKWCKSKKLSTIILLALSIGFGMLTKISVGLIAFITGPMMIVIWIRSLLNVKNNYIKEKNTYPNITIQLIVFALLVFPLGLSFSIRNKIKFNFPIGAISEIAGGTAMAMRFWRWKIFDRFLSFPIDRIIETTFDKTKWMLDVAILDDFKKASSGIYHSFIEYNIWVDLIKTSTYDEFYFMNTIWHPLCVVLYILNYIFYISGLASIVLNIKDVILNIKNFGKNVNDPIFNLKIISIMLFILAISAYVGFNYRYPYSCNSNYRYIAYITFALAISIAIKCLKKDRK